jgi:hypothetical protein
VVDLGYPNIYDGNSMVGGLSVGASERWNGNSVCANQAGCQSPPLGANEVIMQI